MQASGNDAAQLPALQPLPPPHAPRLPARVRAGGVAPVRLEVPAFTPDYEVALQRVELHHLDNKEDANIIPLDLFFRPAKGFDADKRKDALQAKVASAALRSGISQAALDLEPDDPAFLAVVVAVCHQKVPCWPALCVCKSALVLMYTDDITFATVYGQRKATTGVSAPLTASAICVNDVNLYAGGRVVRQGARRHRPSLPPPAQAAQAWPQHRAEQVGC